MAFPQYMKMNTFYRRPLLNVSERKLQAWCMALLFRAWTQGGLEGIFQQGAEHIKQILGGRLMPWIIKMG